MAVAIRCPTCGYTGNIPDRFTGPALRCQKCKNKFTVAEGKASLAAGEKGPGPPAADATPMMEAAQPPGAGPNAVAPPSSAGAAPTGPSPEKPKDEAALSPEALLASVELVPEMAEGPPEQGPLEPWFFMTCQVSTFVLGGYFLFIFGIRMVIAAIHLVDALLHDPVPDAPQERGTAIDVALAQLGAYFSYVLATVAVTTFVCVVIDAGRRLREIYPPEKSTPS